MDQATRTTIIRNIVKFAKKGDRDRLIGLRIQYSYLPLEELRQLATAENNQAFINAIEFSFANILEELRVGFGLTVEDARRNENEGLRAVASTDDVISTEEILRELRNGYGLDLDDLRESDAIGVAASLGNIDFIKASRDVFGIVDDDIRANGNAALISAASGGHSDFLRYIRENFGLTDRDARDGDNEALVSASSAGHLSVLRELLFGFGLTTRDARTRDNQALIMSVYENQTEALVFLLHAFGLEPRDVAARGNLAIQTAEEDGNVDLAEIIRTFIRLSPDERNRVQAGYLETQRGIYEAGNQEGEEEEEEEEQEEEEARRATATESISFNIEPPFTLDNYSYETGTCFDFVMFDNQAAKEYLDENPDNVIMINAVEEKALCFTKSRLREIAGEPSERFIECLGPIIDEAAGEKGQRWIPQNPPFYVKVPSDPDTGANAFIPFENLTEAVDSRERIFCIVPLLLGDGSGVQASFTHTITEQNWRQLAGFSYVSANHCQRGSNILLYKFVKCRFDGLSRAPSWTLEPTRR